MPKPIGEQPQDDLFANTDFRTPFAVLSPDIAVYGAAIHPIATVGRRLPDFLRQTIAQNLLPVAADDTRELPGIIAGDSARKVITGPVIRALPLPIDKQIHFPKTSGSGSGTHYVTDSGHIGVEVISDKNYRGLDYAGQPSDSEEKSSLTWLKTPEPKVEFVGVTLEDLNFGGQRWAARFFERILAQGYVKAPDQDQCLNIKAVKKLKDESDEAFESGIHDWDLFNSTKRLRASGIVNW